MSNILILHGPNLNLLGTREPETYGTTTLQELTAQLKLFAQATGHHLLNFQSNAEHELIGAIHSAKKKKVDFIIINPGAFTHTSIAIRDAFLCIQIPFIEIHISNIFAREEYRRHSYLSDIAIAMISGLGTLGYEVAIQAAEQFLENHTENIEPVEQDGQAKQTAPTALKNK